MAEQTTAAPAAQLEDVQEEYLSAQRAAVEAVFVGRETLQAAVQQGEQLQNAENMADETQFKLDKAGRVLRGMTWSGWLANKFTNGVGPPPEATVADKGSSSEEGGPPRVYQNVPQSCRTTAQAIQNYHANVTVIEECETEEQKETLTLICDNMYQAAIGQLNLLQENNQVESYRLEFASHLAILRKRQVSTQQRIRGLEQQQQSPSLSKDAHNRSELLSSPSNSQKSSPTKAQSPLMQMQDQHLDNISQSLGELGSIANSLHSAIHEQNSTIGALDTKTDNIYEKSKQVTRRADRLIQKKSWTPVKPTYFGSVSIRHLESGKYLAVANNDLYLVPKFHPETCVFAVWKRQGQILGLKNKFASRWVGQNLLGSLACSASSFGRREEWEADEDWSRSRLLCTSAGWGAGGYLQVRNKDHAIVLGGVSPQDTKKAAVFVITNQDAEEEDAK